LPLAGRRQVMQQLKIDGAADFDFSRSVEGFGAAVAYVMSSGMAKHPASTKPPTAANRDAAVHEQTSRIFLDSLVCESSGSLFALSDPVEGKFLLLSTNDAPTLARTPARQNACRASHRRRIRRQRTSSHSAITILLRHRRPRCPRFHSADHGRSWTVVETPLASGNASSGIFSIACHGRFLVAVAATTRNQRKPNQAAIYSQDSGATGISPRSSPAAIALRLRSLWQTLCGGRNNGMTSATTLACIGGTWTPST